MMHLFRYVNVASVSAALADGFAVADEFGESAGYSVEPDAPVGGQFGAGYPLGTGGADSSENQGALAGQGSIPGEQLVRGA